MLCSLFLSDVIDQTVFSKLLFSANLLNTVQRDTYKDMIDDEFVVWESFFSSEFLERKHSYACLYKLKKLNT